MEHTFNLPLWSIPKFRSKPQSWTSLMQFSRKWRPQCWHEPSSRTFRPKFRAPWTGVVTVTRPDGQRRNQRWRRPTMQMSCAQCRIDLSRPVRWHFPRHWPSLFFRRAHVRDSRETTPLNRILLRAQTVCIWRCSSQPMTCPRNPPLSTFFYWPSNPKKKVTDYIKSAIKAVIACKPIVGWRYIYSFAFGVDRSHDGYRWATVHHGRVTGLGALHDKSAVEQNTLGGKYKPTEHDYNDGH